MRYDLREVSYFLQHCSANRCTSQMALGLQIDFFSIGKEIMLLDSYKFFCLLKKCLSLAGKIFNNNFTFKFLCPCIPNNALKYYIV